MGVLATPMLRGVGLAFLITALLAWRAAAEAPWMRPASSSLSPVVREAVDLGRAAPTARQRIVVGLALRNRAALEAFLGDVHDPASPRYGRFLSQDEFNALFAPTEAEEAAVVAHLERHGLTVTDRTPNRLLVRATGSVAAIERAFEVPIHSVLFRGARRHAALDEPMVPVDLAPLVVGIAGLDD